VSMFGLKEAEVSQLVRDVSSEELSEATAALDRAAIEERFARAAWTGIAEPGDGVAGLAIAALGAPRALAVVVERRNAQQFVAAFGENPPITAEDARLAIERWQPRVNSGSALIALRQAARYGARLRVPGDRLWPSAVDDLARHAPIALWTRGKDAALESLPRSIALVGARAATGYGEHVTLEASAGLADRGYTIVSGAAYGIDGVAHRAALASGGLTVAFLAGGVDRFYPSGHDALLTRIVEEGTVISELPCGSPPTKWRFLQRNRLIAAASLATVVLEAGWRSGSLNTANHAADLSRPVGAVPGPVTSAASAGCHKLIRDQKAVCVTTPEEMAELAPLPAPAIPVAAGAVTSFAERRDFDGTRLLDALSDRAARQAPDLAARSGLAVADVRAVLGRLELEGRVRETGRGWLKVNNRGADVGA
jgi:DNA processing protein